MLLQFLEQLILSFFTCIAFAYLMKVPKSVIPYSGCVGMMGWLVYWLCSKYLLSAIGATFFGAFVIAALSFFVARKIKVPVTLCNIPGIVPLVPGAASYRMIYYMLNQDFQWGTYYALQVLGIAVMIAGGLIVFDFFPRFYMKKDKKNSS